MYRMQRIQRSAKLISCQYSGEIIITNLHQSGLIFVSFVKRQGADPINRIFQSYFVYGRIGLAGLTLSLTRQSKVSKTTELARLRVRSVIMLFRVKEREGLRRGPVTFDT